MSKATEELKATYEAVLAQTKWLRDNGFSMSIQDDEGNVIVDDVLTEDDAEAKAVLKIVQEVEEAEARAAGTDND